MTQPCDGSRSVLRDPDGMGVILIERGRLGEMSQRAGCGYWRWSLGWAGAVNSRGKSSLWKGKKEGRGGPSLSQGQPPPSSLSSATSGTAGLLLTFGYLDLNHIGFLPLRGQHLGWEKGSMWTGLCSLLGS